MIRYIQLLLITLLANTAGKVCAQDMIMPNDRIPIYQGMKKINSDGYSLWYALAKGDKVLIHFKTRSGKKIKAVMVKDMYGKVYWNAVNLPEGTKEISIEKEGVYNFIFDAKSMGARDTEIKISRQNNKEELYNPAWFKFNNYTTSIVEYEVDSMIGYKDPILSQKEFKVFDKYLYESVELFKHSKQLLGQAGVHNSQGVGYNLAIDETKIPKTGKLKGYTYSVSSVLGGAKHWKIAEITVTAGALFLSPAASFAAHGAMGLVGPQPGNEPVQYYMSNRKSDIKVVKEIYSPHNQGRLGTNLAKDGIGEIAGFFHDDAKDAVKGTKVKAYSERDLSYNEKGKVTNLFMFSATPPTSKYIIMANPEYTQAKNTKMNANAIYYAPSYKLVKAEQKFFEMDYVTVPKKKLKTEYKASYGSIKF